MKDFVLMALPLVILSVTIAVVINLSSKKYKKLSEGEEETDGTSSMEKKENAEDNNMANGMSLGMCFGVAIGSMFINKFGSIALAYGICFGMLGGMLVGLGNKNK